MKRRASIALALASLTAALAAPLTASAADPVLVFVLAGQSNMVGYGEGAALPVELQSQPAILYDFYNPDVRNPDETGDQYVNATSADWEALTPKGQPLRYGPELTFGKAITAALPGRQIAIVKVAQGGTDLDEHWGRNPLGEPVRGLPPDGEVLHKSQLYHTLMGKFDSAAYDPPPNPLPAPGTPPVEGSNALYYVNEPTRLDRALDRLTQRGLAYQIAGVLWMQGENEAGRKLQIAQEYQARLTAFIAAMRQDLKSPALPFVIGRVSDNLKDPNSPIPLERRESIDVVRAAQKAVDDADPLVALIDTDDFGARPEDDGFDLYHFDSAAYQLMGERFATAFLTLAPGGGGAGQSGAAGAGSAGAGTAGAIGAPAGAGGTGGAGAPAGASGSSNGGSPDDGDGGCSVGATRAAPFVAFLSLALAAAVGLLRRGQRRG